MHLKYTVFIARSSMNPKRGQAHKVCKGHKTRSRKKDFSSSDPESSVKSIGGRAWIKLFFGLKIACLTTGQ